jgi:hypothetical protein
VPVAQNQIVELLVVLDGVMNDVQKLATLRAFRHTQAYSKNSSFRETVDRFITQLESRPKPKIKLMTAKKLAELLRYMAQVIEEEDSFGGFLEYEASLRHAKKFRVKARFRTGNSMGQGSMIII